MENRESWTRIHYLIHEAIEEYFERERKRICGTSLEATIYRILDGADVLKNQNEPNSAFWLGYD